MSSPIQPLMRQGAMDTPPNARSVLITGCSSGIGYCAAQGLARRGYRVFATARREDDVARLRQEGLEALRLDLDDPDSIEQALGEVLERSRGHIYALFNNGGYGQPGAVEDIRREVLRAQLETNVLGWHDLTRRVIPIMRRQGEGRLIQNSSLLGFVAMPYRGAYVCSKFALEGLTDTLRLELRGSGIHVVLIEPGPIRSRFRANSLRLWRQHIDAEQSVHRQGYQSLLARLVQEGAAAPFTLPPEAVLDKVILALESRHPRARYRVTFPSRLFGVLQHLLPTRLMDALMARVSAGGRR